MTLSEEARERLADIVELQPTKNGELQERWDMDSGSEVHQYLESELKEYYYRNDNSLICATPEATTLIDGEDSERIQTVTSNDVPDRLASVASNAFGELVDGNRDTAVFTFEQVGMERICEKEEPAPLTTDAGSGVSCHPRGIRAPTISVGPR